MKVKNNLVSTKQGLEVNKVLFLFHRQKKAGNEIIQNLFMGIILFRPSGAVTTIGKRSTNMLSLTGHAAVVGVSFAAIANSRHLKYYLGITFVQKWRSDDVYYFSTTALPAKVLRSFAV